MNLKQLRKAKKLTQKQLAEQIGVTESSINQYENGKKRPKYETLLLLGDALDCSVSDIVGDGDLDEYGFSAYEQIIIRKYRTLDEIGKKAVDAVLNIEAERSPVIVEKRPTKIIPLFVAAAGPGEPVADDGFAEYEVDAECSANFAVKISGDSMEPELHDGDIVMCKRRRPEIGEIAVIMVNGFLLVKQYITDGMNIYLRSINRARKDLDVDIWGSGNDTVSGYGTVIHKKIPLVTQY